MNHQVFHEFEAYKEAHEDVDMRLILSHPDRSQWAIRHLHLDSLHIQSGSDGCGDIAEGAIRRDGWIIYFQTAGIWQLANGERLTKDSVAVVKPGAEFCLASEGYHDWTSVFLPESLFSPAGIKPSNSPAVLRVTWPGRSLVDRLQATVGGFMAAAEAEQSVTTEAASIASFLDELCHIAEQIIQVPGSDREAEDRLVDRHQLVRRAVDSVEDWPNMSPTVSNLARQFGVSERTLRSAFVEYLGISPYQYLLARRLNHARRLLLSSDPEELTVRQAAAKVGFWDFGRFAEKHRQLFGELPSETLQRKFTPD